MKIQVEYEVPDGDYCWLHSPPYSICGHFCNTGGVPHCWLFDEALEENKTGVQKTEKCLELTRRTQSASNRVQKRMDQRTEE